MSRRSNADPLPLPSKPKFKGLASLPLAQEYLHARKTPLPDAQPIQVEAPTETPGLPALQVQVKYAALEVSDPLPEVMPAPLIPTNFPLSPSEIHKQASLAGITQAELDVELNKYRQNRGVCPLCGAKIGKGATGHISKCLRILKSKTESTTTT